VIDEEAPADPGSRMDFNASEEAAEIAGKSSQAFEAVDPGRMGDPIKE